MNLVAPHTAPYRCGGALARRCKCRLTEVLEFIDEQVALGWRAQARNLYPLVDRISADGTLRPTENKYCLRPTPSKQPTSYKDTVRRSQSTDRRIHKVLKARIGGFIGFLLSALLRLKVASMAFSCLARERKHEKRRPPGPGQARTPIWRMRCLLMLRCWLLGWSGS